MMAWTRIWRGLSPVRRWVISKLCFTILTVNSFLPLFLPCIIRLFIRRSTMGHWALRNLLAAYLPAEWGRNLANFSLTAMYSWRDMSVTWTSSQLHLPNNLTSGISVRTAAGPASISAIGSLDQSSVILIADLFFSCRSESSNISLVVLDLGDLG